MTRLADFYRLFPLASLPLSARHAATPVAAVAGFSEAPRTLPATPRYRQRAMGTGYGRSSGYALADSYAMHSAAGLVRVR